IGGGPGGYVAAIRAAQLGLATTLVEREELGGVCLNCGCIPSKALISAADHYVACQRSQWPGISSQATLDFPQVQDWKQSVVKKMTGGVSTLLSGNGVRVVRGEAFLANAREARIMTASEGHNMKFRQVVLATGSRPADLSNIARGGRILSSTDMLAVAEVPKRLIVLGGGYIGVELGQAFARFGSRVTLIEALPGILAGFEDDVTRLVVRGLRDDGVEIHTSARATDVQERGDEVILTYEDNQGVHTATGDYLLLTVGRRPNTEDLGLESVGVRMAQGGRIEVDRHMRTSVDGIYAIGDIVPGPALAHKASYEGKVAAEVIAGLPAASDWRALPSVVFSSPEVAVVGETAAQVKARGGAPVVGRFNYGANGRASAMRADAGFVRLVADGERGPLVGAQVIGAEASTLIAQLALGIELSATLEDIALTIHAHPTIAEMSMEAAEVGLGTPIHALAARKSGN
ncbi:MAG: dihydrolipoyl dehydrogenase, partial [Firmicutes bacterium]|nr:dihydrolipoyl dehydrogenase [Bacillota bacterium]